MAYDIALAAEPDGVVLMHKIDCPLVKQRADEGRWVVTLLGCQTLVDTIRRHSCLAA